MSLAPGATVDGRYTVLRPLGSGGMAEVHLVRHERLQTLHALKVLTTRTPDLTARLVVEGQTQARLRHPNVVTVSDVIEVEGSTALVMEYVDGPSLDQLQAQIRPTVPQIDDLAAQILAGIEAAHEAGVAHRDLKPENVLIDLGRPRPHIKIADFGLVKVLRGAQEGKTLAGSLMGTPAYMAPEQSRDASTVDLRADVFSAGAVLYELACGVLAFQGTDYYDTLTRARTADFVPLSVRRPDLSPRMAAACRWALEPDRDRRCPSIADLRRAWFEGEPPPPHAWTEPEWRWIVDRHRAARAAPVERTATIVPAGPPRLVDGVLTWPNTLDETTSAAPLPGPPAAVATPQPPPAARSEEPRPAAVPAAPAWVPAALGATAIALLIAIFVVLARHRAADPTAPVPVTAAPGTARPPDAPVAIHSEPPEPIRAEPRPGGPTPAPARPAAGPRPATTHPVTTGVEAPPAPAPVASAAPEPAPSARPRFVVQGADGLTLSLRRSTDGQLVSLGDATAGTWDLVAFFEPLVPVEVARLALAEGAVVHVRCSATAHRCAAKVD